MRVNLFIKYFSEYGGAEKVCFRFAEYLLKNGVDVRIFCGENRLKDKHFAGEVTELGLMRPGRFLKALSFFRRASSAALKADGVNFSFEKMENADIFRPGGGSHRVFMQKSMLGLSGSDAVKKKIKRTLDPVNMLNPALEKKTLASARLRCVIAISGLVKDELQAESGADDNIFRVVHNGVDKAKFSPERRSECRGEMREKLGVSDDIKLVGFVSSNFQLKGLPQLVSALKFLPDEYHIAVAGGRGGAQYKQTAENDGTAHRLHFFGKISDMPAFYAGLDVLCHPTFYDTFASVTAEAMSMGIPACVSKHAGSAEIIKEGVTGFVINELTPDSIADKIIKSAELGFGDYGRYVSTDEQVFAEYLKIVESI